MKSIDQGSLRCVLLAALAASSLALLSSPALAGSLATAQEGTEAGGQGLRAMLASSDWRVRHQARVLLAWQERPEDCARAWSAEPLETRAGTFRFVDEDLLEPDLAAVLLDRFLYGAGPSPVRAALLEVISRSELDWSQALAEVFPGEPATEVRVAIVSAMRRGESPWAERTLLAAMSDPSPSVRAEAARVAGWREDSSPLEARLVELLGDEDPQVRALAARSLGWHRVDSAWDYLVPLLSDSDSQVRLRALHALARMDSARLAALPDLSPLLDDPDPAVARAASSAATR